MKQKPKIIVIGSGIVGASIAMSCLNLGADVVVLERDNLGGSASSKSFGWINASFAESTDYFKLRNAAVDKFRNLRKEIVPILNRRIIYPFYLPLISMICCLLLVKNRKKILYNKYSIFIFCFFILLFLELILKFTGFSKSLTLLFALLPIILTPSLYFFLIYEFSKESKL